MLLAEKFPEVQVSGVDLSPIQPLWVAPNTSFLVDDMEAAGFVHVREQRVDMPLGPRTTSRSRTPVGLSPSDIKDAMQEALEMVNDASLRLAMPFTVIYAQKPVIGAKQGGDVNTVE
ncbi:methyltransferase domain-containing protein [Apiospora phragmitis]|uniref:Methyltransferase domain-containing protein n=1 Tax=Apiospora phragmitis TaxID=2905665 RepID=A0ABR1X595_9PEZI